MTSIRAIAWVAAAGAIGLAGCEGRPRVVSGLVDEGKSSRTGPSIAVLDLSDGVPEEPPSGWLGLSAAGASMNGLVRAVDRLGTDRDVRGVLVRLGSGNVGLARAGEVSSMLASLGVKMPVYCHADDYGNATLYLAALGCKRVWVSPAASVDAIGIAAQTVYFHKLLADELGVDVDFLQVGKFKGAEEPFTRDGPSAEARESLESTLGDMRAVWLDGIHRGRPSSSESSAEDGPYSATMAKERGLIDEVGYFEEARTALQEVTGAVRARVVLGAGAAAAGGGVGDVLRSLTGEALGSAPVALVRATGSISLEGGGILGDGGGIVARRLSRVLNRLRDDEDVRAVVLRIDSPGGSALASDLLWHDLMGLRKKKTLVVSVGGMAASGGYYLASTGQVIFADETSIVGSIGVVGGKLAADHALERVGVHGETFAAKSGDAHAAARAAYDSLLMPWDDATRARVLETMRGVYDLFLQRVAEGRGVPIDRVAASAEGRIFSGRHGMALGLVDEMGGLREALVRARSMAGLPSHARVAVATNRGSLLLRTLTDDEAEDDSRSPSPGVVSRAIVHELDPDVAPFLESLAPLARASSEHVLCALPFALTVR